MKIFQYCLILVLLSSQLTGLSQKKYQGLLWEISGNGLTEKSYLYGTMHVSNKLAFNVSDSFFICLDKVNGVALESSPATWMEDYRDMGSFSYDDYSYGADFYRSAFNIVEPDQNAIFNLLENQNGLMNQILYRFNPGNEDYQENTFLDMFIYQAGAKNGKPIYSLEDLDEVMELSLKAMTPDKESKRDNRNNNYLESSETHKFVLLEDAYRRGDLDQIDSLSKVDNPTKVYHHYFIVQRNINMVERMDSIMKKHSIFTGIGAAHLPGQEGAIELLRKKGYTVRPVSPKSSGKSHKMRQKLVELYKAVPFTPTKSADNFFTVATPGKLFEMPTYVRGNLEYLCPEPINGGYFSIIRLSTFGPLYNKTSDYYKKTFDSLIYIATPGDLVKKEELFVNGYQGYNILSKTSKNAYVNYHVFFTPIEIIVFKATGIGNYIQKSEPQSFFDKIQLAAGSNNWTTVSPKFGGAQWQMKGTVHGQDMIDDMDEELIDPFYQSFDNESMAYFQVMRYSLNDLDYIEEDSFDLAYLGKTYANQLGYKVKSSLFEITNDAPTVVQQLEPKTDHLELHDQLSIKIITQGGIYYLMATTAEEAIKDKFFNSFSFLPYRLNEIYDWLTDSTLFYKVKTHKKPDKPDYESMGLAIYKDYYDEKEKDKDEFLGKNLTKMHHSYKSNESIFVGFTKFHAYDGADSKEEFWDYRIERLSAENGFIVSRKNERTENEDLILDFLLTDTASSKGILTELRLHGGVLYTIQSLIDTLAGPSEYVRTFFDSFTPLDTLIGRSIFEDKAELFILNALGEDSLAAKNTMKSIRKIDFKEKDIPGLIKVYNEFKFNDKTEDLDRENVLLAFGNIENQTINDFLTEVYLENDFKSDRQFAVLKSFSLTETQATYDAILKLLLDQTPFTENNSKLSFFNNLYDSLELSKNYFPNLLDLVQYPEYKPHVVKMLASGYLDSIYTLESFESEKSNIFRNANIELKRSVANQNVSKKQSSTYYNSTAQEAPYRSLFLDYYSLMCAFKINKDKDAEDFFKEIYRIKDKKFILEAEIIHHELNLPIDTSQINEVANDLQYRIWAYNRLKNKEMLDYFPQTISQQDMAYALLYSYGFDEEKDSVVFLRKIEVDNGKDKGFLYVYKRKTEDVRNWMIDYIGIQPLDELHYKTENLISKKGLSVKNDDEIESTISKTIEIIEMTGRKRVVVNPNDYGGLWGGLF